MKKCPKCGNELRELSRKTWDGSFYWKIYCTKCKYTKYIK